MPASTVHRVLVLRQLNRLSWMDRPTELVIRRYEHEYPGDLVHVDVKKLVRIPPRRWLACARAPRTSFHWGRLRLHPLRGGRSLTACLLGDLPCCHVTGGSGTDYDAQMVTQERRLPAGSPAKLPGRPTGTVVMWLLLCVLIPLFLIGTATTTVALDTDELWPTLLLIIYSGTHLAVRFGRGDVRIVSASFWLFVYVAMSVATLAQISTGLRTSTPLVDVGTMPEAALLTLVGCVAYDAGQFARRRSPRRQDCAPSLRGIHFGRLNVIGVIGVAASIYYIHAVGLSNFFSSRGNVSQHRRQVSLPMDR